MKAAISLPVGVFHKNMDTVFMETQYENYVNKTNTVALVAECKPWNAKLTVHSVP